MRAWCRPIAVSMLLVLILAACGGAGSTGTSADERGVGQSPPSSAVDFGDFTALLIGIDRYQKWPSLQFAESDAQDIRDILLERYAFHDNHVRLLLGQNATRVAIWRAIEEVLTQSQEHDSILIYYAGHGQLDTLIQDDAYWIPWDGELEFPDSWISLSRLQKKLISEGVKARNVLVMTDSCFGGGITRGVPDAGTFRPLTQEHVNALLTRINQRSRQVIASGGLHTVPDKSPFAQLLKSTLKTNPYPVVDMEYLFYNDVFRQLKELGQEPLMARLTMSANEEGQFLLVKPEAEGEDWASTGSVEEAEGPRGETETPEESGGTVAEETGGAPVEPPPEPMTDSRADELFWESVKDSNDPALFRAYLAKFPQGTFAELAERRLRDLATPVPNLIGLTARQAMELLRKTGYKLGSVDRIGEGPGEPVVYKQAPEAGQRPGDRVVRIAVRFPEVETPTPVAGNPVIKNPAIKIPINPNLKPLAIPAPPKQVSPASGRVFSHFPRKVVLRWERVPNAKSYTVEIQYYQSGQWTAHSMPRNLTTTSHSFLFVGAQPGRWRVWAVETNGKETAKSPWWDFRFTR